MKTKQEIRAENDLLGLSIPKEIRDKVEATFQKGVSPYMYDTLRQATYYGYHLARQEAWGALSSHASHEDANFWKAKYEKCIDVIKKFDAGIIGMYDL